MYYIKITTIIKSQDIRVKDTVEAKFCSVVNYGARPIFDARKTKMNDMKWQNVK